MGDESKDSYSSKLNFIKSKPLIIEKLFSYSISRPNILYSLISKDKTLIQKLNEIFSKVSKYNNKLGKEFTSNLNKYSKIRETNLLIEQIYKKVNNFNNISYSTLKGTYNFSVINYLLSETKKQLRYNLDIIDENMIKGLIFDYYSTFDSVILTFLPQRPLYLDGNYICDIARQNMNSQENYKYNQKIKLILLFDDNYFFNNIFYKIKLPNIEEIEIIFDKEFKELYLKQNHLLHIYLNNYLSKIDVLDKISKINFHNLEYENDLYQSILGYLFDGYYLEKNEDIKQQLALMINLKAVNIEMTFLYIYEKIKLYFYIYELFPSLNIFSSNKKIIYEVNFTYYLNNKILIINNKNSPLIAKIFLNFIDYMMNNENIEFIFVINHNKLIIEDNIENIETEKKDNKINLSRIREFTFINQKSEDIKDFINKFIFNKKETHHVYEGYDIGKNLIYYRIGEAQIKSFDLIELFKNSNILERIEFINENITVNFNIKRSNLQILYNGKTKADKILNNIHYLPIIAFTKFIGIQTNLTELTINRFDYNFNDIFNDNIQILTINYEKEISTLDYKNTNIEEDKLNVFPNLVYFNLGSKCDNVKFLKKGEIPKCFKKANLILKYSGHLDYISKIKKKFKKYKKEIYIEIIGTNDEEEEEENYFEEEDYEDEDYEEEDEKLYEIKDFL